MAKKIKCHSHPVSAYGVNSGGNPVEGIWGLDCRVKPDNDKKLYKIYG